MKRTVTSALAMLIATLCLAAVAATSALALAPDGSQGWYWQMPQPSGDLQDLYDVAMPSSTQAWAVGANGSIFHTTDAGASWSPQTSGTAAELWSVEFADDHDGWVLGGGVLLRTTDAGVMWTKATPAGVKGLNSLSVVGPDECWLGTSSGVLLHTVDGSATWQTHRLSIRGALSVDFIDAAHGWATGPQRRLWRTQDGGATWELVSASLPSGGWFSRLSFTDHDRGWLEVDSRRTTIWTTSDAGTTWRKVLTSRGEYSGGPLFAADSSHAWFVEQVYQDTVSDSAPVSYLRHTGDGGATWTRTCVGSAPLGAMAAYGGTLISLSDAGPARSTDGGTTWTSGVSQAGYSFSGAQAVSRTDVWATDRNGALLHSSDGLHWQEQPDPVRWSVELRGLSFPDAADGWLVGSEPVGIFGEFPEAKAVLLHTVDAGATWKRAASPLTGYLSAVDFTDAKHGWIVSASAWNDVARTSDGGLTWTLQRVPGQAQLSTIDFVDPQHGWVAGSYQKRVGPHTFTQAGGLFATSDGGATWRRRDLPSGTGQVEQVKFLDAKTGWAVGGGRYGWVARSTDGGRTWTRLAGFSNEQPSSIQFTDPSHGWLGGSFGIYATSDGGATWQRVAAGGYHTIIAAADAQHLWGFADGGLVSTVDGSGDLAAPTTFDNADWAWHGSPLTVHLWPSDLGGSGLAGTQYSLDGGASWQNGTAIDFPATEDQSTDGTHELLYRSSDAAGNVEATRLAKVRIDTLGPKCAVPWKAVVNAGAKGILRFKATDLTSGVARATITISGRDGRVVRSFVRHAGRWDQYPRPPYFWIRFTANLKPGNYRVTVTAKDQAGNAQVSAGDNLLHIVRSGAPRQRTPHWTQGLPGNFFLAGAPKSVRELTPRPVPANAVTSRTM